MILHISCEIIKGRFTQSPLTGIKFRLKNTIVVHIFSKKKKKLHRANGIV